MVRYGVRSDSSFISSIACVNFASSAEADLSDIVLSHELLLALLPEDPLFLFRLITSELLNLLAIMNIEFSAGFYF